MSEITTGSVALSLIGAPLTAGTACLGAAYFAGKYCVEQYDKVLQEIEKADRRLKWLDKQQVSSPAQIAEEAKRLQELVSNNNTFIQLTKGLSKASKDVFAGAIATQNSPLKSYVPTLMDQFPESESCFEKALKQGTKNLALDGFRYVNEVVKDAAKKTGFTGEIKILKQTESVLDIVFAEKTDPNKKFTAYSKLNKEMNPSLALDLEGFGCDTNECTLKMNEIIEYLQSHGVPFNFKRAKHSQSSGVLRNMLNKIDEDDKKNKMNAYLTGDINSEKSYLKQE